MAMMFRGLGKPTDQLDIQLAQASDPFGVTTAGMGTTGFAAAPVVDTTPKRSTWGEGGKAWDILGGIGDTLSALGGGRGSYLDGAIAQRNEQRDLQMRAAAQQAKRQADWEDWVRQKQWERDNPAPINNDTVNDYNFYRTQLGEEGARRWLNNQTDPVVSIPLPGGQTYIGPRSGLGAATKGGDRASVGNSAPQGAIDYLRANPSAAE